MKNLWFRKCHMFLIRSPNQGICRPVLIPCSAVVSDHTVSLPWSFSFLPSVKGYLTHLFRGRPAGNSWKEISVCTLYLNPSVGTWQNFWGFSNDSFTKMLLSSETQTQCVKLKDHETLGYVEMLINSINSVIILSSSVFGFLEIAMPAFALTWAWLWGTSSLS